MTISPKTSIDPSDFSAALRDQTTVANGLTARAGGGQALGTAITARFSRFSTVATAADSATLPPALPGASVFVFNAGANAMNVFPSTGQQINALGANTAFSVPAGRGCHFFAPATGLWNTLLGA